VENEFSRAVTRDGNVKAQLLVAEVFELRRVFEWRGLGPVPYSALRIKKQYADYDAELRFRIPAISIADNKACECGAILRGVKPRRIASCSARSARLIIQLVRAWCRAKAHARRITVMEDSGRLCNSLNTIKCEIS